MKVFPDNPAAFIPSVRNLLLFPEIIVLGGAGAMIDFISTYGEPEMISVPIIMTLRYIILVFVFLSVMAAVVKMRSNSRRISFIDKFFVLFIYFLLFVWTVGGLPLFS